MGILMWMHCVGHSLGEFTALVASECLSLEDGVRLVRKEKGRKSKRRKAWRLFTQNGACCRRNSDDERLVSLLQDVNNEERGEVCDVANVNSSNQVVLSGKSGVR